MRADGWSGRTRIDSHRPFSYDRFGTSVAVSGRNLVVGANRHDSAAGRPRHRHLDQMRRAAAGGLEAAGGDHRGRPQKN
jgi:hypothetical protein